MNPPAQDLPWSVSLVVLGPALMLAVASPRRSSFVSLGVAVVTVLGQLAWASHAAFLSSEQGP